MPRKFDLTKIETINLEKKFRINEITEKKMAEEMSVIVSHLIEHKNSEDTKKIYDNYDNVYLIEEILPEKCMNVWNPCYDGWWFDNRFGINTILEFDNEFRCAYDIIKEIIENRKYSGYSECSKTMYFLYKLRLICNYLIDVYKLSYIAVIEELENMCERVHKDKYDLFTEGNALYADDEYIYALIIIRLHFFIQELNKFVINFCSEKWFSYKLYGITGMDMKYSLLQGVEIPKSINTITSIGTITTPSLITKQPNPQPQPDPLPTKETTPTTQQDTQEPKTDPIPETPQPEPQPQPQPITTNKTISHVTDILESKYIDDNTYTNIIEKMCKEGWITKISENQYIWNKLQNQFIRFIEWFHEKGMISVVESDEDRRWQEFCNDFKFKSQKGPKDIIATKLTSKYSSKIGYIHGNAKREIDDFLSHLLD